ncbi:hypothetical protein IWQ62_000112 [Dispira parvispora]|uniref:Uncharacterized protein n=1 Tax=Dispira parvispora TaxID=1520584 RepID=A0A9W8E6F1_9FUNG|nr:hypothetical protein IWQ62_000112 [Dispira parvispora]
MSCETLFAEDLFDSVTTLNTRSEDLESDLGERVTHQSLLEAKNAMIDALYFKACRLEFASKKAMGFIKRTHKRLTLLEAKIPTIIGPTEKSAVTAPLNTALRYLEIAQVPIEDEIPYPEMSNASDTTLHHEKWILDTYVSGDEESDVSMLDSSFVSHSEFTQLTLTKSDASHPLTPDSIYCGESPEKAPPATRGATLATPPHKHSGGRHSVTPKDLSEWTPESNTSGATPERSPANQLDTAWPTDTPCKSSLTPTGRIRTQLPTPSLRSVGFNEHSPSKRISSVSSTLTSTPCGHCRESMRLFSTWQAERDILNHGMNDLASQVEEAHGKLHAAESQCRTFLDRLNPLHQRLKANITKLSVTVNTKEDANSCGQVESTMSTPTKTATETGQTRSPCTPGTEHLLNDLETWVDLLVDKVGTPSTPPTQRVRPNSVDDTGLTSPLSPTLSVRSPNYSLIVSPMVRSPTFTYSVASVDILPTSPTSPRTGGEELSFSLTEGRESLVDPWGAVSTMEYLDRFMTHEEQQRQKSHESRPLTLQTPPSTVYLDAITYTDFATFTLGLATQGVKRTLLTATTGSHPQSSVQWNSLHLAHLVMVEDIRPCLMASADKPSKPLLGNLTTLGEASGLDKERLLEAVVHQRCEIEAKRSHPTESSRGNLPNPIMVSQPGPTKVSPPVRDSQPNPSNGSRDTITLSGPAKRRVSIADVQDQYVAPRTRPASCIARCALCGQNRECGYTLSIPREATRPAKSTAAATLLPLTTAMSLLKPDDIHSNSSMNGSTLGRSWKALTGEFRWGRKPRTAAETLDPSQIRHPGTHSAPNKVTPIDTTDKTTTGKVIMETFPIDRFCRDRVVVVCDLVGYLSQLSLGLWDHVPLVHRYEKFVLHRQRITWARLGCLSMFEPEEAGLTSDTPPNTTANRTGVPMALLPTSRVQRQPSIQNKLAQPQSLLRQTSRAKPPRPQTIRLSRQSSQRSTAFPQVKPFTGSVLNKEDGKTRPTPTWKRKQLTDSRVVLVR